MNWLCSHVRVWLLCAAVMSLSGAFSSVLMPKQEDPSIAEVYGRIIVTRPGYTARQMERGVVAPLERELRSVSEIKTVDTTIRAGVVVMMCELSARVVPAERDGVWRRVRSRLDRASREFPGSGDPAIIDTEFLNPAVALYSVKADSALNRVKTARLLAERLEVVEGVGRVRLMGRSSTQISVEVGGLEQLPTRDTHVLAVADALQHSDQTVAAGVVDLGSRTATLSVDTELEGIDDVRQVPVVAADGSLRRAGDLARVYEEPERHPDHLFRHRGEDAVVVVVEPKSGIDSVRLGRELRKAVDEFSNSSSARVSEVTFQPRWVQARINGFAETLGLSALLLSLCLGVFMGWRLGLVVGLTVPATILTSLSIYAAWGGTLQQVALAALSVAMGLIVDASIVVAEKVQGLVDDGQPVSSSVRSAVKELALPLGTSTATTMVAFLPMLLARGVEAEFMRSLPVMVLIALGVSYLYSLLVTPSLCLFLLRKGSGRRASRWGEWVATRLKRVSPALALVVLVLLAGAAGYAGVSLPRQVFPDSGRNQFLVSLRMPEGSSLRTTSAAAAQLEQRLLADPRVVDTALFVGRGAARFYYNVRATPSAPHVAQFIVTTRDADQNRLVASDLKTFAGRETPRALVTTSELTQGRGRDAAVVVRLSERSGLEGASKPGAAAEFVASGLKTIPGARDVWTETGYGAPVVDVTPDPWLGAGAATAQLSLARHFFAATHGLVAGAIDGFRDDTPIRVYGEPLALAPASWVGNDVLTPEASDFLVGDTLSQPTVRFEEAALQHHNGRRVVRVLAQLEQGVGHQEVLPALRTLVARAERDFHVVASFGGEKEGERDAVLPLLQLLPVTGLLLVVIILLEFRSLRLTGIVFATIPVNLVGALLGLWLARQSLGLMAALGVVALSGIVMNNAILLLDSAERSVKGGASPAAAIEGALVERTRPVFLTTITTLLGMLPLALSDAPLWPPLAFAMIGGLSLGTVVILVFVPMLYVRLKSPRKVAHA